MNLLAPLCKLVHFIAPEKSFFVMKSSSFGKRSKFNPKFIRLVPGVTRAEVFMALDMLVRCESLGKFNKHFKNVTVKHVIS